LTLQEKSRHERNIPSIKRYLQGQLQSLSHEIPVSIASESKYKYAAQLYRLRDPPDHHAELQLRLIESNLNLDLLNWSITILSVAITSYFCCSSNWSIMDAFYITSYKMPGKKANRLQRSVRPVLFIKIMVRALNKR
jgi:hypothetical protein